jgi:hypothetical protein
MDNSILMGIWRIMISVPPALWEKEMARSTHDGGLGFMTAEHHRVRDYVVRELPRIAQPIPPERIAADLGLPLERVVPILDELERNMTFLFRNADGAVTWAYPVTVDKTPHQVTFSSGEKLYAA